MRSFSFGRVKAEKLKVEIGKAEMNQGRLPVEFRERTKGYASATIRLFVKLPKGRDEIRTIGKQFLRAGTSVAAHVGPVKYNDDLRVRAALLARRRTIHWLHS